VTNILSVMCVSLHRRELTLKHPVHVLVLSEGIVYKFTQINCIYPRIWKLIRSEYHLAHTKSDFFHRAQDRQRCSSPCAAIVPVF